MKSQFSSHIVFGVSSIKRCLCSFSFFTQAYSLCVEVFANRIPGKMRKPCFPLEMLFLEVYFRFGVLRWNTNLIWIGFLHRSCAPGKCNKLLNLTGVASLCPNHTLSKLQWNRMYWFASSWVWYIMEFHLDYEFSFFLSYVIGVCWKLDSSFSVEIKLHSYFYLRIIISWFANQKLNTSTRLYYKSAFVCVLHPRRFIDFINLF